MNRALIGLGILPQLYEETLLNREALGWALVSLLLAIALGRSLLLRQPAPVAEVASAANQA